jgi:hypothetical protein
VTRQRKQQRAEDYDYSVRVEIEMTADAMEELLQDPGMEERLKMQQNIFLVCLYTHQANEES